MMFPISRRRRGGSSNLQPNLQPKPKPKLQLQLQLQPKLQLQLQLQLERVLRKTRLRSSLSLRSSLRLSLRLSFDGDNTIHQYRRHTTDAIASHRRLRLFALIPATLIRPLLRM